MGCFGEVSGSLEVKRPRIKNEVESEVDGELRSKKSESKGEKFIKKQTIFHPGKKSG